MKKILLVLLMVLVFTVPAWSAELTLTNQQFHTIGSLRMVTGTAVVASGDTFVVPLGTVVSVQLTSGTAINQGAVGYSISGNTITLYVDADIGTVDFAIMGY